MSISVSSGSLHNFQSSHLHHGHHGRRSLGRGQPCASQLQISPAPWLSRGRRLCQRGSYTYLPAPWRRWVCAPLEPAASSTNVSPSSCCTCSPARLLRHQVTRARLPALTSLSSLSSSLSVLATKCQGLGHRGQVLQGLLAGWAQGLSLASAPDWRGGTRIVTYKGSRCSLGAGAPSGKVWGGVAL